jgi:hypothetical protein
MVRLERFLDDVLATRTDPGQRQILLRYAVWHLLGWLRPRHVRQTIELARHSGQTLVVGQKPLGAPAWQWPKR